MVISIASQKGGTGKTSSSISIAAGLVIKHKKRVLLVDIDSQANSSKVLVQDYPLLRSTDTIVTTILKRQPLPIRKTALRGLDIVPSHILLSDVDLELTTARDHREARLKERLDKIKGDYDFVIIDCPPSLSWLTINALTASDRVLVVVSPGYFELDSIQQLNKTIDEVVDLFNPDLQLLGYVFTMSDPTVNSRESLKILRQTFTNNVLKTIIPRNTDLRDAHMKKTHVFDFSPRSKSALAYERLIQEIFV